MEWVGAQQESLLHAHLLHNTHLVSFAPPALTLRLSHNAPADLPQQLHQLLHRKTGHRWTIAISEEMGHTTLHEKAVGASAERRAALLETPLIKALMTAFPGSTLMHEEL